MHVASLILGIYNQAVCFAWIVEGKGLQQCQGMIESSSTTDFLTQDEMEI